MGNEVFSKDVFEDQKQKLAVKDNQMFLSFQP